MKAALWKQALWAWGPPAALFVLALALFSLNSDFKLGLHTDEVQKIQSLNDGQYQYFHPLLMLEATKAATWAVGRTEAQTVVEVGRLLSAAMGAVGVATLFLIIRRRIGDLAAAALCLAAITTPLLAVHAHYLKEDIWLFAFCATTVFAYEKLNTDPRLPNVVLLGLSLGLAVSSKAVGVFLIPVLLVAAFVQSRPERMRILKMVAIAAAAAIPVIVICNIRMLLHLEQAWQGLSYEFQHGAKGNWDGIVFPPLYHLTHSMLTGLGPGLLVLAAGGLGVTLVRWRRAGAVDWVMLVYAFCYYGLIEASPLKSGADMVRYAVPLVLPAAYFGAIAMERAAAWAADRVIAWRPETTRSVVRGIVALALIPTAITGARLVLEMKHDTRLVADQMLAGKESHVVTEGLGTSVGLKIDSLGRVVGRTLNPNIRYLVASSFVYDRFAEGASISPGPNGERARRIWALYQELFSLPYCEIRPRFMSYGFSNPTIRIIDLQAAGLLPASVSSDPPLGPNCLK